MAAYIEQDKELIFALDIGTRSIVGVVGRMVKDRFKVLAVESAEYAKRTMMDGQIDDIDGVAALARVVTDRLEHRMEVKLTRVCVAAAGRALRTQRGVFGMELPTDRTINAGDIGEMEAGAVGAAEEELRAAEDTHQQFYLVGYSVSQYRLDNYPLTNLQGHSGKRAEAEVVATFLPGEVVDSLYSAMQKAQLQVASMTLEPIAAMNAAIPAELRLLNLALVDIGAGTSDIALCRDGSVVGYTMVTQAGDEITETIMRSFLVDFQTAEYIKRKVTEEHLITYNNILGLEERVSAEEVQEAICETMDRLANSIAHQILEINGGAPSALFLAGGGSKLSDFKSRMAAAMGMEDKRVALVGNNFAKSAFADDFDLNNPEYATPLGIAVSAGMGLLNDSYVVKLNGQTAKLFRNGALNLRDILLMNGYSYGDLVGKTGQNLTITLDGRRMVYRGEPAAPAILRVNDVDATITTMIHAGDNIDFIPARSGADAEKTLGDVLGEDFVGRALVNNAEVPLNTKLRQGDTVLTLRKVVLPKPAPVVQPVQVPVEAPAAPTVQPVWVPVEVPVPAQPVKAAPVEVPVAAQPVRVPVEAPVAAQPARVPVEVPVAAQPVRVPDEVPVAAQPVRVPVEVPVAAQPVRVPVEVPASVQPAKALIEEPVAADVSDAVKAESEMEEAAPVIVCKELDIYFNDRPFYLPGKESGEPYYLMDLLEYSGIDFRKLDRRVRMEVNGEECGFQTVLQKGDRVVIRPE